MSLLKKLSSMIASSQRKETPHLWVYAECDRCGEKLRARVNLYNDLSIQFAKIGRKNTYFTHKKLIGNGPCFNAIEVELTFDRNRMLIDHTIQGGRWIGEKDFQPTDDLSTA
jgi:hypothetical protein